MTALERIQSLIHVLPEKDRKLANTFIEKRQFESLYELVSSDIYKARKKAKDSNVEEIEVSVIADMSILKSEIINYIDRLGWNDEDLIDEYEEF